MAVAVVVIAGQTLSLLLLTPLVTPVAYSLFDDLGSAVRRWRGRPAGDEREGRLADVREPAVGAAN